MAISCLNPEKYTWLERMVDLISSYLSLTTMMEMPGGVYQLSWHGRQFHP